MFVMLSVALKADNQSAAVVYLDLDLNRKYGGALSPP